MLDFALDIEKMLDNFLSTNGPEKLYQYFQSNPTVPTIRQFTFDCLVKVANTDNGRIVSTEYPANIMFIAQKQK